MPRKSDYAEPRAGLTHEEWLAQEACPKCGGRPGYDPVSGVQLKDGHTYNCETHREGK